MSLETRLLAWVDAVAADIVTLTTNVGIAPLYYLDDPTNESITEIIIQDDNSATSNWVNRWVWKFQPFGGAANLVQWVNEYGELRLIPAKYNTVAFRIFAKQTAADTTHSGPVFEICDTRIDRNTVFEIDGAGNMVAHGAITREVPSGPTLQTGYLVLATGASVPANTPTNTLIVRY